MRAVIVYESVYGNTREVAEAVADGVHTAQPEAVVRCLPAAEAGPEVTRSADLLVVGGPTHMHGMTSALSRRMAVAAEKKKDPDGAAERTAAAGGNGPGLRGWFHSLPEGGPGVRAAAFDTRADIKASGGAAHGIARRLSHHHYDLVARPEGFVVEDSEGPMRTGELERAKAWGATLI
ncbi:flavodoxin domain-containing protein [Kitasatospora sp. NPDC093679]|uniref:flavodoxin family protein n=1 Tax=Kitasatospora sp. NPDC093679 TaxID=3154983 RepID=UPI00341A8E82